jgi:D-lactate dehydrogenase (cytochrome)
MEHERRGTAVSPNFIPCGPGYLHDESRLGGRADWIIFPEAAAEAAAAISRAAAEVLALTIQGARTGITGGAVPQGGLVLSGERMNRPLGFTGGEFPALRVQGGMNFDDLSNFLRRALPPEDWDTGAGALFREQGRGLAFTPNPTETTATLGGGFACNARGPNSLRWGGVGDHVQALVWISPGGELWSINRGQYLFDEGGCPLPGGGRLPCDTGLPAGGSRFLWPRSGLDLVDFLAGSEGLAGFAAELSLGLRKEPAAVWGVVYFFERDQAALEFAEYLRQWRERESGGEALTTLEYYDRPSLELVRRLAPQTASLRRLPSIIPQAEAAIQIELEGNNSDALESILGGQLAEFSAAGGREDDTWAAASPAELERFRLLRHAVPELINMELDRARRDMPELRKIALDFMVKPEQAAAYREMYRRDMEAEGLRGFVFGHIAEGRLHVNILPENQEELRRSRALQDRWAASVRRSGGLLAAENGIGRLKRDLLCRHLSPERLVQIRSILHTLDPAGILGGFEPTED